jgi:hypothetical protein
MTDQNDSKKNTENKKPRNNRYRKNNRNNKNKKKPTEGSTVQASGAPKKKSNNNNNKNRRPKTTTPARVLQKYDNLLEQHLIARRKFSEVHGRVSGKQLSKVTSNLEKTRKSLHEYESTLQKDWQTDIIKQRLNLSPEDRQFSTTHGLEPVGDEVSFEGEFPDPHLLVTQKETSWSSDTEESVGTTEDYEKYKQSL